MKEKIARASTFHIKASLFHKLILGKPWDVLREVAAVVKDDTSFVPINMLSEHQKFRPLHWAHRMSTEVLKSPKMSD